MGFRRCTCRPYNLHPVKLHAVLGMGFGIFEASAKEVTARICGAISGLRVDGVYELRALGSVALLLVP